MCEEIPPGIFHIFDYIWCGARRMLCLGPHIHHSFGVSLQGFTAEPLSIPLAASAAHSIPEPHIPPLPPGSPQSLTHPPQCPLPGSHPCPPVHIMGLWVTDGHSSFPPLRCLRCLLLTVIKYPGRGRASQILSYRGMDRALCMGQCVALAALGQGLLQGSIIEQEKPSLCPKQLPRPLHAGGNEAQKGSSIP